MSVGISMRSPSQDPREYIISQLRGSTVMVPDLQAMIAHWPAGVNAELDALEKETNERFEWLFPGAANAKRLKRMKSTKACLFGASWWPYASYEALCIATWLSIWLFVWDDETDSAEFADLVHNLPKANEFRRETMDFIRESLGYYEGADSETTPSSAPTTASSSSSLGSENLIISSFEPVGKAISDFQALDVTKRFYNELDYFVKMSEQEQEVQMTGKLPSVAEYMDRRMGSSAVRVCLAITEYAFGIKLPPEVMLDADMETLWNETNVIISVSNDILSVKKELEVEQVDSLIPLLTLELGSVQAAVVEATQILRSSIDSFDKTAERLLSRVSYDASLKSDVQKFVDGCQCACTGNLNWSLESGRYRLGRKTTEGGLSMAL